MLWQTNQVAVCCRGEIVIFQEEGRGVVKIKKGSDLSQRGSLPSRVL